MVNSIFLGIAILIFGLVMVFLGVSILVRVLPVKLNQKPIMWKELGNDLMDVVVGSLCATMGVFSIYVGFLYWLEIV
ncbi:hypothetical protein A2382_05105 [Candidatus Woesebacteria bacterium RIFOXYB1_FULL_38_16]|uniref:Uncharacterized protein n=1 Tax=Candidatus Woesebacteria bacterium RIFOXYB1_FULL_38_16 TaxID=1802538 RepID=A0A1F8CUT6_9BACT|nr:MAG: hypothetical protein A2382_05105 [Candidatus Woesebacteria bacterium RIFOXYB1_FULL_38_16]